MKEEIKNLKGNAMQLFQVRILCQQEYQFTVVITYSISLIEIISLHLILDKNL